MGQQSCSVSLVVYRIIVAVRVKVVAQYMTVQAGVYIEEPSPLRVIVPALQIVQPRIVVVIVPTVPERIEHLHDLLLRGRSTRSV